MKEWLEKGDGKGLKFSSPDIQNEILEITSHEILREIMVDTKEAGQYSVMSDETADKSNTEQLVICLRWVDDNLEANEEIIGLQPLKGTSADDVFPVIKDVLLRLNLNISDARANVMLRQGQ